MANLIGKPPGDQARVGKNGQVYTAADGLGVWKDLPTSTAVVSDGDKGDITVSGSGTIWSVDAGAIDMAELSNGGACTVVGRAANSIGVRADIAASADGQYLGRTAGVLGFSAVVATASDLALTKKAPASGVTVTAGYSCYVADEYECVSGVETEIGALATLEIG